MRSNLKDKANQGLKKKKSNYNFVSYLSSVIIYYNMNHKF